MGTIRKIVGDQHTDPLNSAAVINRMTEDVLSNSRLTTDGQNFPGFAQTQEGIPRVASAAARDALFPTPLLNQRVANDGTGYIEHWNGSAWFREAPIGNAGPRYCPFAQGAKGDDLTDDGPAITNTETLAAPSGAGLAHGVGVFRSSARTLSRHHQFPAGAVVKPTSGNLVFAGGIDAGPYPIFDQSLGGRVLVTGSPLGYVRAEWWKEIQVTVPAPLIAPGISAVQDTYGSTGMTIGHTYSVGYAYVGYDGNETAMSPVTVVSSITGFGVAVAQFFGTLNCRAIAVRVYWQDNASPGYKRALWAPNGKSPGNTYVDEWGFGDQIDTLGPVGVLSVFDSAGAAFVGSGAHDKDGTVLSAPTIAPVVSIVADCPVSTTLYGAYSYTCEDGTETAVSPISAAGSLGASGGCIRLTSSEIPPSGAVTRNWYLGTSATAGAMRRQLAGQPLHYYMVQINSYNAGGASNSAGACLSHVSGLQQAWNCIHDSGGGRTALVGAGQGSKVPVILGETDGNATGITILGEGGSATSNADQRQEAFSYIGTATIPAFLIKSSGETHVVNIDFRDPNHRVLVCRAYGDPSGGVNFDDEWRSVGFQALAPGGVASQVNNHSGAAAHTASEQQDYDCTYNADAWPIDARSNQTANLRHFNPKTITQGNSGSMNSGDVRLIGVSDVVLDNWSPTAHGGCCYHIGSDHGFNAGGSTQVRMTSAGAELDNGGPIFGYISSSDCNAPNSSIVSIDQGGCINNLSGRPALDLYCGSAAQISYRSQSFNNTTYLNNYAATINTLGKAIPAANFKRVARFAGPFPSSPAYSPPIAVYGGGYGCGSDVGKMAEVRWVSGTATIDPASLATGLVAKLASTITVTGAAVGDSVWAVMHAAPAGTYFWGVVSATDTVQPYQRNDTGGTVDVASGVMTAIVLKVVQ